MNVLVLGTVALDSIETPFGKADRILGGSAPFTSLAASYAGAKLGVVSVIGHDLREDHIQMLKNHSVDTEGIERKMDKKSFYWSGKYHTNMNIRDTLVTELNVLENFDPKLSDRYKNAEYVMLGNLHPTTQMSVIEQLSSPKFIVLDTMNFWIYSALEELKKVINQVHAITINDEEAIQLTNEYSLLKAARMIHSMGPQYVIIKKGEHGAFMFHKEDLFFAPALPLEKVIDPTGAGDTFAGGLLGYIASHSNKNIDMQTVKNGIAFGSVMASFAVEKFGTERLENLNSSEINERLTAFKQLTSY